MFHFNHLISLSTVLFSLAAFAGGKSQWAYDGKEGPHQWGKLKGFELCEQGKEQSPVDLKWNKPNNKRGLKFGYTPVSNSKVLDNGHTVQVNFDKGNFVEVAGQKFELLQLHFHAHSEHSLSNKFFPLEMHLVHKNSEGKLAIVGVFFEEGKANAEFDKIWAHVPSKHNEEKALAGTLDLGKLLPSKTTHYHYMGSLTTPPCSEGVNWNVLNTPMSLSKEQLAAFKKLYSNNFRPVQSLHSRLPANF
jgi:carbonic anhydrase